MTEGNRRIFIKATLTSAPGVIDHRSDAAAFSEQEDDLADLLRDLQLDPARDKNDSNSAGPRQLVCEAVFEPHTGDSLVVRASDTPRSSSVSVGEASCRKQRDQELEP